jgi:hypothetical protein
LHSTARRPWHRIGFGAGQTGIAWPCRSMAQERAQSVRHPRLAQALL